MAGTDEETGYRVAADIGGTFTDIGFIAPDGRIATRKLLSTPENYADAVALGVRELASAECLALEGAEEILHGCTVATNAILEQKGARTALITTRGFRDVLELRRIRTPRLYEPLYKKPPPLVPRRLRFEVDERVDARGDLLRALDPDDLERVMALLEAEDVEAVAVCLLHAYANPTHERAIGDALRRRLPGRFVSLSVDVLPQIREYERTSTTVINAYVGPPVRAYLRSMREQLQAAGIPGRLMVMQSGGGILDVATVLDLPAQIVECGPAAGVIGAARLGSLAGYDDLITFDMGGTTAKASIVEGGEVALAEDYEVGGGMSAATPLLNGGGYALKLPAVAIAEVGAGGGSIVTLDKAGAIKVGPESAGAVPGPACYGQGGAAPTVTDANVVLGYLNPEALAGGSVPIDARRAKSAIIEHVAAPLGRDVMETAFGIHAVANANMMRAIKAVTTYRGRDPRDFALFAFGGSGGVHAATLARGLQIARVVIPPAAGVFSAFGLLAADVQLNLSRAFLTLTASLSLEEAERAYAALEHEVAERMGYAPGDVTYQRFADMRYAGQAFELTVPLPEGALHRAAIDELGRRFEAEHERRYGHSFAGAYPIETVSLRVVGRVPSTKVTTAPRPPAGGAEIETTRDVCFSPGAGTVRTPVLPRAALGASPRPGPLVIEEYEGTTVVPPGCTAALDGVGSIVIEIGAP